MLIRPSLLITPTNYFCRSGSARRGLVTLSVTGICYFKISRICTNASEIMLTQTCPMESSRMYMYPASRHEAETRDSISEGLLKLRLLLGEWNEPVWQERKVKREGGVNLLTELRRDVDWLRWHRSTAHEAQIQFCGFGRRHALLRCLRQRGRHASHPPEK